MGKEPLLEIKDLCVSVKNDRGEIPIVKKVNLAIPSGTVVGLVGESGSGKSMTAKTINGILPPKASVTGGSVIWHGSEGKTLELQSLKEKELRKLCGTEIGMVFQEPMTSLNPMMRVGDQVREVLLLHGIEKNRTEAAKKVVELFDEVGIPEPELRYKAYPHQLSGGMRQRVMIAMAVICKPKLLIADEPTTALDVTIEAQILKLIRNLCRARNMSALVITHNMNVVSGLCDEVYVMYMGRIVERAAVDRLFKNPLHPYTKGLLSSIPLIGEDTEYLQTIPGNIPELDKEAAGCDFCLRCSEDIRKCFFEKPSEVMPEEGHYASCHVLEGTKI